MSTKILKRYVIPLLPMRGVVMFPHITVPFDVGRESSIKALENAMNTSQYIFLATQKNPIQENPEEEDIYIEGAICQIKQLIRLPENTVHVMITGISRGIIHAYTQKEPFFMVEVQERPDKCSNANAHITQALKRLMLETFKEYVDLSESTSPNFSMNNLYDEEPGRLADLIAFHVMMGLELKQDLITQPSVTKRLRTLCSFLSDEVEILKIEKDIAVKTKNQIDQQQREYFLREQIKVIQDEIGDKDSLRADADKYLAQLKHKKYPASVKEALQKEIQKLSGMNPYSPETGVSKAYIECVLDLPWGQKSTERNDLQYARKILDRDHFGLQTVKDRIVEFLAVKKLKNNLKGPILCLSGPPGVGKTSIVKSIATALNRKYVRISLGGVHDESEIRGHRKTYIGSMPGRIVDALKQAKTSNPVILLDEIDKLGRDHRGDPASALLEVLDSEQNRAFRDHYVELPVDLSDVLFITTANNTDTIPPPLLDRMELIELSGYTEEEKTRIALDFLIKKQLTEHGLSAAKVKMDESAVREMINYYTRESGVRKLERTIGKVVRQVAAKIATKEIKSAKISQSNVERYLGKRKYSYDKDTTADQIGVCTGLAWTIVGGDTLSVEVNVMPGAGKIELTGSLGDVMKESARTAISYIRSKYSTFNISKDFFKYHDIHVHVPEGATPKDGPSAGVTITTALISAITEIPVKGTVAMTGEITLRGRVLPIGGLKEKVLAANRAGKTTILLPHENEKDLEEIPDNVKANLVFVLADHIDTVFQTALTSTDFPHSKAAIPAEGAGLNTSVSEHVRQSAEPVLPVPQTVPNPIQPLI